MVGNLHVLIGSIVLTALSGVPGLFASRRALWGQWLATAMYVTGGFLGLVAAFGAFRGPDQIILQFPTPVPGAEFVLGTDAISAFFVIPILLVTSLGSIYGLEYWKQTEHPRNGRKLRLFYGLAGASLVVLVLAKTSIAFLVGWEGMAVSAFFIVGTEDEQEEVRDTAWLYFAASHAATVSLFMAFAVLFSVTGRFDLAPLAAGEISPQSATAVFLLALAGFGLKAGLMPLHFWLPSAHAMAPSHVSALMSGVLIKSGIYGLVRITWLLPAPQLWWGELLLALGAVSAVLGVAFAIGQHDLKRLLAYSSIENIGIITIGLGLALVGRSLNQPLWIVLGMSGCLLHVWNHALFKSLLFLCAGSVIHSQHTRQMDQLGGLAKRMPWTAAAFLVGATAICGLPTLNGFISEFLIYSGLFHTLGLHGAPAFPAAAFVVPILAFMGALALACFVRVFGVVFLGTPRVPQAHSAHEAGWAILTPLGVLAGCCAVIGLAPTVVMPILDRTVGLWARETAGFAAVTAVAPLGTLSVLVGCVAACLIGGMGLLYWRIQSQPLGWTDTWGCGYMAPTPRMQYTESSLAEMLVATLGWALRPTVRRPQLKELFPREASFESHVPEVVLDRGIMPTFNWLSQLFVWVRLLQQGRIQVYLLYIFVMLLVLLFLWR